MLAIIPGLLATAGLVRTDYSLWMAVGLVGLVTYLLITYRRNNNQLAGWSLLGLGMLAAQALMVIVSIAGGLIAILTGTAVHTVVLLALLITFVLLLVSYPDRGSLTPLAWGLLFLIILCQLAVRIKYFVELGYSWSVLGQWLSISLYAAMIGLLLPVFMGMFVARRYGYLALLFIVGMIFVGFQNLIDVNEKVSDQIGSKEILLIYKILIPLLFTVLAPLWYVRFRSSIGRLGGLLALIGLAVLVNLLTVGVSYRGELPVIIWVSFIPYTLSVLLTVTLAYLLLKQGRK